MNADTRELSAELRHGIRVYLRKSASQPSKKLATNYTNFTKGFLNRVFRSWNS